MSIKDIIKDSFLEGFNTDITTAKIAVTFLVTAVIGIYIFFVYRFKSKSNLYSKDFNNVLAVLPVVTGAIVLSMQSNIVISLGMVGALSIVRFRNAVKSSLDLLFLFWSISVGIICGAGLYEIGFVLSLFVTILMFILDKLPGKKLTSLLVLNSKNIDIEDDIVEVLKKLTSSYKIKSRCINEESCDFVIEVNCNDELKLLKKCNSLKGIINVSLLSHDGEERM